MPVKVFIVDDHEMVRASLKMLISCMSNIQICGEAGSGKDFLENPKTDEADVILLDFFLPDGKGGCFVREFRSNGKKVPILMISGHTTSPEFCIEALRGDVSGFISKKRTLQELEIAIKRIAKGDFYVPEEFNKYQTKYGEVTWDKDFSSQERKVLALLFEGKSTKEIAFELGISPKTVHVYKYRILEKTDTKNVIELFSKVIGTLHLT